MKIGIEQLKGTNLRQIYNLLRDINASVKHPDLKLTPRGIVWTKTDCKNGFVLKDESR